MKTTVFFTVADFSFSICADSRILDALASVQPFRTEVKPSDILFSVSVDCSPMPDLPGAEEVPDDEQSSDFGSIRMYRRGDGYLFTVGYGDSGLLHAMSLDADFSQADICLNSQDLYQTNALSTMLYIIFSMAVLPKGGIVTHASCVVLDGKGYMFLGRSGTGKSTHSSLWMRSFPGSWLLNDDHPVLKISDGDVRVYGSPWSGKTPCYRNESAPLGGIVRLEQAKENRFTPLAETAAFMALLPSCSALHSDAETTEYLYRSVIAVCERASVGRLRCLPDMDAARICREGLSSITS